MTEPRVQFKKSVDGNQAAAHVAYALSDIHFLFPITPATSMGELADAWSCTGRQNIWGTAVDVVPMQSEGGVAGALHGASVTGAAASSFTCSQGLLLMIPDMFKIAGENQSVVLHVASRAVGGQALTIFADHNDVMATRTTGFALLSSHSVQEAADMALIAHLSTIQGCVPFLHFFDGFRTSHEITKVDLPEYSAMAELVDKDALARLRSRGLNPLHPHVLGTVEGADIFFQCEERSNVFYEALPDIVEANMRKVEKVFGRAYHPFDYYGAPDAESVIVMMGAGVPTVEEALDVLIAKEGKKWGLLKVHLYRPWSKKFFFNVMPKTVKRIAVLDRTKECGSVGEPLFLDVVMSYNNVRDRPFIIGGRFGVGGKEFTPGSVRAVFQNLESECPKERFTVGINDDLTHLNIPTCPEFPCVPKGTTQCMFWGLGADGTVGANHDAIRIIGDNTDKYVQGYFFYDAHKSGGLTISHLRFGDSPIKSEYLIVDADYTACHFAPYVKVHDLLKNTKKGGIFALNCPWSIADLERELPAKLRRELAEKEIQFWIIDATKIAERVGLGRRVNTVMQAVFFTLSGVLPVDMAIPLLKAAVAKTYAVKGQKIIKMNQDAIDGAGSAMIHVPIPESWKDAVDEPVSEKPVVLGPTPVPDFLENVVRPTFKLKGDDLPVSAFPTHGIHPVTQTRHEKRGIATSVPVWEPENCLQCNQCSLVCPHAAIRPFALTDEEAEGMVTMEGKGPLKGKRYRLQVSVLDCTGCGACARGCKHNALAMKPVTPELRETEAANWRKVEPREGVPERGAGLFKRDTVVGSQYYQPLIEFSGCCDGCGETPYVKLATQLFGERMCIANAAGCSSVWGGTWGMVPYCTNHEGYGPAWGNSLFEDNAEYGFGMARAHFQRRSSLKDSMLEIIEKKYGSDELREMFAKWIECYKNHEVGHELLKPISEAVKREYAEAEGEIKDVMWKVLDKLDQLVRISFWIVGGDGWAYDIDYGGLDHVVAAGNNVNILILDTEIYSNTGGQRSKATNLGAIAKFAAGGNRKFKKDLGMMLMSYGHVYVASVSIHANPAQCVRAISEAEAFPGTSVILCYCPCKEHGFPMANIVDEARTAVDSGYWPLYRFDPRKSPSLQLDAKATHIDLKDFLIRENRYSALARQDSEMAQRLFEELAVSKATSLERLRRMAEKYTSTLHDKHESNHHDSV